ncbi:tetratricopeptide repeat protein [Paractinoplanes maris]|uniref:tetratricopeptide repeat protein n=1 Tax=Paractinoplanes maris TaxID=1734446 RepID=UPI002020BE54|nr:tetratricopeptide repeat protein [Actinoplanes maris]
MQKSASLAIAEVLAHCGGAPGEAVAYLTQAIREDPAAPEPYDRLAELRRRSPSEVAEAVADPSDLWQFVAGAYFCFLDGDMDGAARLLGSVIGYRPTISWAAAPWFADQRFLGALTAEGLADASLNITDHGPDIDGEAARERLRPWLRAVALVCEREPAAEALARMAILLRVCGLTDQSLALCDQADLVERVMMTEVVRAGTWRRLGDRGQTVAAFRRALALDPANWSLYLDLADLAAEEGDYSAAADLVGQGLERDPDDITLRAAGAAFRVRATGSVTDLDLLIALAPALPHAGYRDGLIDQALAAEGLPADRVAAARRVRAQA